MKLQIEQAKLVHTLTQAVSIVESRNTFPILANVKLTASGDTLHTVASDLDIEVSTTTPADVATEGATTVKAAMLLGIVKPLPKGKLIDLELIDGYLHISAGRSKAKLATLPPEDFPVMASSEYDTELTAHASELAVMFNRTAFAMSTEEMRYYLNGVYLHNDVDGNICAVSTDGHRLSRMTLDRKDNVSNVIIPRKTVGILQKLLVDGDVIVSTSSTKVKFANGDFTVVSKVVDGSFPDYMRVIPTGNANVATASAVDLSRASAWVALVSDDKARIVKLSLSAGNCEMSVHGSGGDAVTEVELDYDGPELVIGFNSKYFADVLSQAESGDVKLMFGDSEMNPVIVEPQDYEGLTTVVMPSRV